MEHDTVIRLRGIRNQFGAQVVHENLDLDVYRGEVLGVVGGSGTGKSVLLRCIAAAAGRQYRDFRARCAELHRS